jgi:hypothetical protein
MAPAITAAPAPRDRLEYMRISALPVDTKPVCVAERADGKHDGTMNRML